MAFLEAAAPLLEGGAEAGGAGEGLGGLSKMLPGMTHDFNDNPVSKITHAFMGNIGTHGGDQEKANIGTLGSLA
jgi:hypothetical protein